MLLPPELLNLKPEIAQRCRALAGPVYGRKHFFAVLAQAHYSPSRLASARNVSRTSRGSTFADATAFRRSSA